MIQDETMMDLRKIRHQISQEFHHNPKEYISYLKKQESKYLKQIKLYENLPNKKMQSTSFDGS